MSLLVMTGALLDPLPLPLPPRLKPPPDPPNRPPLAFEHMDWNQEGISCLVSSRLAQSSFRMLRLLSLTKAVAVPALPALPVRPMRCT